VDEHFRNPNVGHGRGTPGALKRGNECPFMEERKDSPREKESLSSICKKNVLAHALGGREISEKKRRSSVPEGRA